MNFNITFLYISEFNERLFKKSLILQITFCLSECDAFWATRRFIQAIEDMIASALHSQIETHFAFLIHSYYIIFISKFILTEKTFVYRQLYFKVIDED